MSKLFLKLLDNQINPVVKFHPRVEREIIFNVNAYKLEFLESQEVKDYRESKRTLKNGTSIYLYSKADYETFCEKRIVENGIWSFKMESFFFVITDPLFKNKKVIQDPICWMVQNGKHLENYISQVNRTLADAVFKNLNS